VPPRVPPAPQGWVSTGPTAAWRDLTAFPRAAFLERLAAFARVITFDKRGVGLSDRLSQIPTLEARLGDR